MALKDNLIDCCQQYHSYNYNGCISSEGGAVVDTTANLFYPDWEGSNSACIQNSDSNAPDYMKMNPTQWMFATLAECCETHYPWMVPSCDPSGSAVVSNLWCMSWSNNKCMQECNGWDYTYETQAECCNQR